MDWKNYFKEAMRHWDNTTVISPYDKEQLYEAFKARLLDELEEELPKLIREAVKDV